ncbi:hypothetical protein SAMN02746098_01937 [Desulfosporosinus lacus DSM 15449]|uniref:Uncharacterized protein n=1 Tax=Desulfosporosinus lacus DSM 15449 TaxID=1121420 RepID=A0A1M5XCJ5_9FIRM|nr:hypothetical protein SAMN02746098_01937 [Desulfosporosinus lacus DSM 15449]
MTAPHKGLRVN